MKAMVLSAARRPLELRDVPTPKPAPGQVLLQVAACAVCRTDLHVVDGELPDPKLPLIPGHEVVGTVVDRGADATRFNIGERVGIGWLGSTCGHCPYCLMSRENLCDHPQFTGYTLDGGYAEYAVADERFCFGIPTAYDDASAAPLLCAGLIGYRSLSMADDAKRVGIYGFGAAAHIITQVACHQQREIYAFTRAGDHEAQEFARRLGAVWAGASGDSPPQVLDAAIIFAPVGSLVVDALRAVRKGGTVVCGGIHMSDIPSFPYELLWGERVVRSVANLTRKDGEEFFAIAARSTIHTATQVFRLDEANDALDRLRSGRLQGAAVLVP